MSKDKRSIGNKNMQAKGANTNSGDLGHDGKVSHVMIRNEFYSDGYKSMRTVALVQFLIIISIIVGIVYFVNNNKTEHVYFATTDDGRLITIVSLARPNLANPALMSWAAQATTEVMTFGFHDYRRRLNESSRHFTRVGWESFNGALGRSRIMEMVDNQKMVVTSSPRSAPIVLDEGVSNGRYFWLLEIPISVTYQAGNNTNKMEKFIVEILIVRVPQLENPNCVGIERWKQKNS